MKKIFNWRKATVSDIESDGFLDVATIFHVLSYDMVNGKKGSIKGDDHEKIKVFLNWHIDNKIPVVFHNGVTFDIPLCEKLLGVNLDNLMVIDTLPVSWYLNVNREAHGLATFLEDYGVAKPEVDDWENLSYEEYKHRCEEDVKINRALWNDFMQRLVEMYTIAKTHIDNGDVGGKRMSPDEEIYLDRYKDSSTVEEYIDRILTFLMFKADCARLQEKTRWKADVVRINNLHDNLSGQIEDSKKILESAMPPVPKYGNRSLPKKPYLKDNKTLSQSGKNWNEAVAKLGKEDEYGNPLAKADGDSGEKLKVITEYNKPNANSSDQIKKFLFLHGWVPQTFKYVKDEKAMDAWVKGGFKKKDKPVPRKIPQINKDGDDGKELCHSVIDLAEEFPEIMAYQKYTLVKHRLDMTKGFIRDMSEDGYLKARVGGYTNTLRLKHRELVNLPGIDKPYGKDIRGSLIAGEGKVCLGSDLSSLEDRTKHHFMLPHDPKYVETMMEDDYDPHILMALSAGLISQQEYNDFKAGKKTENSKKQRKSGKATNYASVYNAGAETIARSAGVPLNTGKQLFNGYWKLNWSVKEIAEEQVVIKTSNGLKWLINPINGFCYSLRKEQDRFSTLCQGTGSYFFDMWLDQILDAMMEKLGYKTLTGSFHDEYISVMNDSQEKMDLMEKITFDSIEAVNKKYLLRRKLGCDVQFGQTYAEIH